MNVKNWPTKKLLEIMQNPYSCSDIGTDFENIIEEIRQEYYERMNKKDDQNNKKLIKQNERRTS